MRDVLFFAAGVAGALCAVAACMCSEWWERWSPRVGLLVMAICALVALREAWAAWREKGGGR